MLTLAESARTLVQQANCAMLSTISDDGTPYGSIVEIAPAADGDIILLLSRLAEHQRFLHASPRASVLIAPSLHQPDVLAKPRVTLLGKVENTDLDETTRQLYLGRHPDAQMYLSLGDFSFYRLRVEKARYIAGFGRMGWLETNSYSDAEFDVLWEIADGAIEHMNTDHRKNLLEYVRVLAGKQWAVEVQLTHIDRYGMDITASGDDQCEAVRVSFDPPLVDAEQLRPRLIDMARQTRSEDP